MYFRIHFDPNLRSQWFLDTPISNSGDEWAFWRLRGNVLGNDDLKVWRTKVIRSGQTLPFSFAGFDVPIVDRQVGQLITEEAPGQVQLLPLEIEKTDDGVLHSGYFILVATKAVRCVDERRSDFIKWEVNDNRPDKVGEYRMISKLSLDSSLIPHDLKIFRIQGWQQALIVSESLAKSLRNCVELGIHFESVS